MAKGDFPHYIPTQQLEFDSQPWSKMPLSELWDPGRRLQNPGIAQDQGGLF